MLDFRVNTFLEVCRHMNYTKAAETLHITQPAVSQHIHFLEEHYRVKLFSFQGKKMFLTEAGKVLLKAVTTMKHDQIYLMEKLQAIETHHPTLTFGATLTVGAFVMPNYLVHYRKKHPETNIKMIVSNTHELLDKITSGDIDFAIIEGYFDKDEYDYLTYSIEKYIAVCKVGYQFTSGREPHCIADLLEEPLILREPGSGTREVLEKALDERNLSLDEFHHTTEVGSISALKALILNGLGITFLYHAAVANELQEGSLREIPLSDCQICHNFSFIWRRDSIFSRQYQQIFHDLCECR